MSLPHVFGAEALATTSVLKISQDYQLPTREVEIVDDPYAIFIPWQYTSSAHLLAQILQNGIKARISAETIVNYGHTYLPGTLVITRDDNKALPDFDLKVIALAERYGHSIFSTPTGLSSGGPDLGSNKLSLINIPKILVLGDEGVRSNNFGATWHYFEKVLEYPISIVRVDELRSIDLDRYNILVMPSGNYPQLTEGMLKKMSDWVSGGGKLIAIGGALQKLEGESGFSWVKYSSAEEKQKAEDQQKEEEKKLINRTYGDRIRSSISDEIPGAIIRNKMDDSHPLAYGFPDYYFSLKTGSEVYQLQKDTWNVITVGKDPLVLGFAGKNIKNKLEGSVSYAVANKGRGTVIYMVDDPLFRGFWENGKFLFSNAIFMVDN
ncbi:MAG: hypothetical protein IPL46_12935 [Saprospiraceae bacterium]|nr:hypothetical protein [Saprospiraceae bacterium]